LREKQAQETVFDIWRRREFVKQKKQKGSGVKLWSALTGVTAILLVVSLIGTNVALGASQAINIFLKTETYKVVDSGEGGDATYFETGFNSVEELEAYDKLIAEQLAGEGAVLLMNRNNALPLSSGDAVSTFSHSAVDIATCGTGSADIDTSNAPTLKEALESRGLTVNPILWDFYDTGAGSSYVRTPSKGMGGISDRADYHVNEVPLSVYTSEVMSSYAAYQDAAIVVISRLSGELYDLPRDGFVDGGNALELTEEEQDMLKMVGENFDKVVVLINSANAMECDFLTSGEYDIDAALWIGYTGTWGLNAVADILVGNVNPSGHLVDTWCNDNTTAPAITGLYASQYANYDGNDPKWYTISSLDGNGYYIVYQEGIYVGYRYYETRYEDMVMGQGNAGDYDYAATVAFPFGYGLSYTTFDWSDYSVAYNANTDSFEVKVTVTNTGDVAGKEVVQVYFQSPYTDYDKQYGIEKAAVELCGFGKTDILAPGASETVTVTVPREELAAYDSQNAKTYILDAGTYYLTAAANAHAATNNVLAAKGYTVADGMTAEGNTALVDTYTVQTLDSKTYSTSSATGYEITNQFDSAELSNYGVEVTYLSRSNWQGTWPGGMPGPEATWPSGMPGLEATDEMFADGLYQYQTYTGMEGSTTEYPTMGADNGLTLAMMIGLDYDDPAWDDLLDQATFEEMATLIGKGYHNTAAMPSVGKPATLDDNGPQGFTQSLTGVSVCHTAYSDANTMAATFNVELMEEVGKCIGADVLDLGATGLYGPAMNIHRNAYAGRNFEYYSEDGFLSGKIAAAEVKGIQSKGVYVYIKHFALNDSETHCRCISTWANEQTIRELYLKPFEMAVVEGGAYNVMNSFARIGTIWSGAHYGLMTEVLRNEWGMRGFALTDFSGNAALSAYGLMLKTYDVAWGLLAGTDSWDSSAEQWTNDLLNLYRDDADIAVAMREATHRILYTVANSGAMNGISATAKVVDVTPWWQTALYVVDGVIALCFAGSVAMLVLSIRRRSAEKKGNGTN
jgi:beta-glucosidase